MPLSYSSNFCFAVFVLYFHFHFAGKRLINLKTAIVIRMGRCRIEPTAYLYLNAPYAHKLFKLSIPNLNAAAGLVGVG